MSDFNTIKNLYEDGYRCIYYDKLENNHTIYLKNFDNENSTVIELEDENERCADLAGMSAGTECGHHFWLPRRNHPECL